jgi:hypothetical protein
MSGRSQRRLAPASTAHPPIAPRAIVKRTKASRACSVCQEKRIKVGSHILMIVGKKYIGWPLKLHLVYRWSTMPEVPRDSDYVSYQPRH